MGNSVSTITTYETEIQDTIMNQIRGTAGEQFGSLGENTTPSMAKRVAEITNGQVTELTAATTSAEFQSFMQTLAAVFFVVNFDYYWIGESPPGAISGAKVVHNLCSISAPIGNQITEYLKNEVFSQVSLPPWVENQVTPELVEALMRLTLDNKEPTWRLMPTRQVYDSPVGDGTDFKVDIVIVSVNGAFTNDGLRAGLSVIYFVGVFYQVKSNSKATRDSIRRDAFASAAKLAGVSTLNTDAQLSDALEGNASSQFQQQFGFSYGSNPPESWRAEGVSSAYLESNSQLIYLPIMNPGQDYLRTAIESGLFIGLGIPIASVQRAAVDDLTADFLGVLSGAVNDSWVTSNIDRVYQPADPTINRIHQKSILMSWYKYQVDSNGATIPVTYIFVQTIFYEEVPAEQRAVQYLFHLLCDEIRQGLQKPPVADDDVLILKGMLQDYAKIKFQSTFGFTYSEAQSSPPAQEPGCAVRGLCDILQTEDYPASTGEIENWLNAEVIQKDGLAFPRFANNQIWEKIRDDVIGFTKTSSDGWSTASDTTVYQHPDGGMNIKQYSLYVYTAGKVTYAGVSVARTFVCYLGVYCGTLETS